MNLSFAEWLSKNEAWEPPVLNKFIRPDPIHLEWPRGPFKAPRVMHDDGRVEMLSGPGLVCWDFDQTLTTAVQFGGKSRSTAQPNWRMINLVHQSAGAGNKNIIVTARGVEENELRGDKNHPLGLIPAQVAVQRWGLSNIINPSKDVHLLGGVKLGSSPESKGPVISRLVRQYGLKWGVLYDDGSFNIDSVNAQQKLGMPVEGRPVALAPRDYERGPEGRPNLAAMQHRAVGVSGM